MVGLPRQVQRVRATRSARAARVRIGRASTNVSAAWPPAAAWIRQGVGDTARPPSGQNVSGPVEAHQPGLVDDTAVPALAQARSTPRNRSTSTTYS
jgi:hypothetical protein